MVGGQINKSIAIIFNLINAFYSEFSFNFYANSTAIDLL